MNKDKTVISISVPNEVVKEINQEAKKQKISRNKYLYNLITSFFSKG